MKFISFDTPQGRIEGRCDSAFSAVADAFVANFASHDEVDASVALSIEGRTVVDLWGGCRTRGGAAWAHDTVATVFSATKGAMALCAHMLADRGLLSLDAKISD